VQGLLVAFLFLCLIGYLSFHTSSNLLPEENGQRLRHTVVEYGVPGPWFHFETYPDKKTMFTWKINWFSSSTGLMLLGLIAWYGYWQIEKAKATAVGKKPHWSSSPQAMVSAWVVLTVFAVAWGFHPLYLGFARVPTQPKTGEVWSGNKGAEIVMFLGPNSPTVSDRLASYLGLDPAQRAAMDQALGKYVREFRALEDQNTQAKTDENGHQLTTIAPPPQQIAQLAERFWSELDSALDGRQLTLGRKTVGLGMGMFETGDYGYRVEIWRVGQINPWYHWRELDPSVTDDHADKIKPSSGPALPEKLRRFWKEPAINATQ
jgi:hypothetical protein